MKTLTRQELYDAVWTRPVSELAREFGVSEYTLWQICKHHDIPRPGLHYWHRLKRGIKPEQPPLPTSKSDDVITIEPSQNWSRPLVAAAHAPSALKGKAIEEIKIEYSLNLDNPHPLIRSARHALRGRHVTYRGMREAPLGQQAPLDIDVSESQLPRALAIMDSIIRALETLKIKVNEKRAQVGDQEVRFGIYEKHDKKSVKDTSKYPYRKFDYTPNGVLTFRIIAFKTYSWSDKPGVPLESRLPFLLNQILLMADKQRAYTQRIEENQRQWKEEWDRKEEAQRLFAQQQAEVKRRQELELQRRQKLEQAADNWDRARRINAFLDECARTAGSAPSPDAAAFMNWARQHGRRLDPFQNSYLPHAIAELAQSAALPPITGSNAPSPFPNQNAPISSPA